MKFSQRKGLTQIKEVLQIESMDNDLRNSLWNIFLNFNKKFNAFSPNSSFGQSKTIHHSTLQNLFFSYWSQYLKEPLDLIPIDYYIFLDYIKLEFFKSEWFEVYDVIEFIAQNITLDQSDWFIKECNKAFEKELSGYRFVSRQITDITNTEELSSIQDAINCSSEYLGVQQHLSSAVSYLSDRKSPDYRNSTKESISAVESLCKVITGDSKATLGQSLKRINNIHPAFKVALSNLYGYTNDSGGIRHSIHDNNDITYSDAKFMLITCSAYVNYIIGNKAQH